MKEVRLSKSSESVFNIIRDLHAADTAGCLSDMIFRVTETEIETQGGLLFILGEDIGSASGDYAFREDGASWFTPLRESNAADVNSGNRAWIAFIEQVSQRFHNNYSHLEYFCDKSRARVVSESTDRAVATALCKLFGIKHDGIQKVAEDVNYAFLGATLKLMLNKNGFSQPVLAKVLFSNGRPVKCEVAEEILASLTTSDTNSKHSGKTFSRKADVDRTEEINDLLSAFFAGVGSEGDLLDYLILNGEEDNDIVRALEGYDDAAISCDSVKLLNLFSVNWPGRGYDVLRDDTPLFRFVFGLGDLVSLTCNCGDILIGDGYAVCHDEGGDVALALDLTKYKSDFGLDSDELAYIKSHSPAANHAFEVTCRENIRTTGGCRRYRCQSDTLTFDGGTRRYCADCPYAEVISYVDDKPYLTSKLVYSSNSRRLTTRLNVVNCSVCGRPFDNLPHGARICHTCSTLIPGVILEGSREEKRAHDLYRTYSYMLPLGARMFSHGTRLCAEDEQIVVFRVGEKCYMYDKRDGSFRHIDV